MRVLFLGMLVLAVVACSTTEQTSVKPHDGLHGLKGGVLEPTYPPDGPINCWIQPPHDKYWYPCIDENIPHY